MPKTYWHLLSARRMPTEYELVSSDLLYHPRMGYAVRTPVVDFQARHPLSLSCANWEAFRDPRQTTYASYVTEQRDKENYIDRLLGSIDGTDYDRTLNPTWLHVLESVFAPLRYPCHGLHMASAYIAQGAPAGRIAIAAAFQTGDELRRVQRIAYRTQQLMQVQPAFAADAQARWEREPAWQPLRETVERLLVCYEWGEAFVALNLVVKPLFDEFVSSQLASFAREQRDDVLARLLLSLREDQLWHRAWSVALVQHVLVHTEVAQPATELRSCPVTYPATELRSCPDNLSSMQRAIAKWQPRAEASVLALSELCASVCGDRAQLLAACVAEQRRCLAAAGLLTAAPHNPVQDDAAGAAGNAA